MDKIKCKLCFVICFCMLVLSGCASASPVVKTSSGNYNVIGYGPSNQQSRNVALNAATKQCRKAKKQVMVVSEDSRYKGLISAEVNKAVKVASSVAKAAGKTEASKTLGAASSDDSYETEVNFVCE
jgi:hypothetical protein